jgi:hypothetical protein
MVLLTPSTDLHQASVAPSFTTDSSFCLILDDPFFPVSEDINYTVHMGDYSCTLIARRKGGDDDDFTRIPMYPFSVARFSAQVKDNKTHYQ